MNFEFVIKFKHILQPEKQVIIYMSIKKFFLKVKNAAIFHLNSENNVLKHLLFICV